MNVLLLFQYNETSTIATTNCIEVDVTTINTVVALFIKFFIQLFINLIFF